MKSVTLAELDASVGTGPEAPDHGIAVRYYTDEALLTAVQLRQNAEAPPNHSDGQHSYVLDYELP